jgi:glycosyltransferase involved in cell wall biosynthesis
MALPTPPETWLELLGCTGQILISCADKLKYEPRAAMKFCSDQESLQESRKRILFLSMGVPPLVCGQTSVISNLATQFSREEMIVAGEEPSEGPPFQWEEHWPQIFYLTKSWRRGRRWGRRVLFPLLLIRSLRLARRYRCKHVVTVFPTEEFLLAGYLTALCTGARFYPYFHNTYLENQTGLSRIFAGWLQNHVFSKAAHVFVMSEGMVEFYRDRYPELKCSPLVHSFSGPIPDFLPPSDPRPSLRFMITGAIWDACLDATTRACDAISQVEDASLTFLSGMPRAFLEQIGVMRSGFKHETVPHGQVITRLRDSDIVVLPHGFDGSLPPEEYRTMFPTRTIEYLLCGRPILAHTPPGCFLTRFLKEHDCALVVDKPSVPELLEAIRRLRTDEELRTKLVRNALRVARMFHAPGVAATLRAHLQ